MTWLAWRQFRVQAWVAVVVVAIVGAVYTVTGLQIRHLASLAGYPKCVATGGCGSFVNAIHDSSVYPLLFFFATGLMYVTPALIGIFWGAPLAARELGNGSYRLVWTQSITRTTWLGTKLLLVGAATILTAGLLSLIVTWWSAPIDDAGLSEGLNRFTPIIFGARGIAPIGYALFALTLGVVIGILIRHTLPAMAITVAVLLAVQIVTPLVVRPHYQPPVIRTIAVTNRGLKAVTTRGFNLHITAPGNRMTIIVGNAPHGAWVLSDETLDSSGRIFIGSAPDVCLGANFEPCATYIFGLHLQERLTYQPASRYWTFQIYETSILILLSLGFAGLSVWRVRKIG